MTATKIWRRSSRRFVPAKQRISKCAPSSYASKNEHGPMRSSSCLPIRSSNIWPPAGAPSTSPWKKDSKPLRRSVSSKYHQKMPPAITASPHLVPPLPTYCIAQTSSSPRSSPSLGLVCPRRKNSNQNDLFCEFSYLAGFWLFGLGGEDGQQCGHLRAKPSAVGVSAGGVAASGRGEFAGDLLLLPGRRACHARAWLRPHSQHRLYCR